MIVIPVSDTGSTTAMKINEFSKLTNINAETIRSYRNKGFLKPRQLANGYYDYTVEDYISLIYLRKLRGYSFSLDRISTMYQSSSAEEIIESIRNKEESISREIEKLQEELRFLELERMHLKESTGSLQEARVIQSVDEKIDVYRFHTEEGAAVPPHHNLYHMMTPTILISKEILNGECEEKEIPVKAGLGTYRYVLRDKQLKIPEDCVILPNGTYITQVIQMRSLDRIWLPDLKPMMDLAKERKTPFISDTTGFLVYIENAEKERVYHFRIRACIAQNDISTVHP